ncbi:MULTISPECIES: ParA family protein [unclassified Microbacterium]|uniref:ParA family protein n=1 Tax=unclassified Microbacterium TaxID=2609290 RepID=UPI00386A49CD
MTTGSDPLHAHVHVTGDDARVTSPDGQVETLTAADADGIRRLIVERLRGEAAAAGEPVDLVTSGDRGEHTLRIAVDGEITAIAGDAPATRSERRQQAWWATDPEPAAKEAAIEQPAAEEQAPGLVDEVPLVAASPETPAGADDHAGTYDPADDDDIDEDTLAVRTAAAQPARAAVPEFFLPAASVAGDDAPSSVGLETQAITFPDETGWSPRGASDDSDPIDVARAAFDAEEDDDDAVDEGDRVAAAVEPSTASADDDDDPAAVDDAAAAVDDDDAVDADDHADAEPATAPSAVPRGASSDRVGDAPVSVASVPLASGLGLGLPAGTLTPPTGARPSFIEPAVDHPATVSGWRAFFVRLGIPIGPSRAEQERAEWEKSVSRQWAGCRAIAVANGKGGVGKTMTTAVLSAVFARYGGGNVLAWDNNDTRGTLGWRTEQGDYDTTIRDLLPQARQLLDATASVSDIARFVHHQSVDRYDVLRSNPELLAADQRITTADFDLLAQVAARYYRMVIFDSGNDESADRWLRMIDSAHQLVVPTLAAPESAESAALLLDALRHRDEHSRRLADNAVVIVGQSEKSSAAAVRDIAAGFEGHVRAVSVIPFDDALKAGPIRYDRLQSKTKDAWMRAAASVAEGL